MICGLLAKMMPSSPVGRTAPSGSRIWISLPGQGRPSVETVSSSKPLLLTSGPDDSVRPNPLMAELRPSLRNNGRCCGRRGKMRPHCRLATRSGANVEQLTNCSMAVICPPIHVHRYSSINVTASSGSKRSWSTTVPPTSAVARIVLWQPVIANSG